MTRADSIASRAQEIFGTPVFDGAAAVRGYALNAMCFSFNKKENREAFQRDEEAYMRQFRLSPEQADAVRTRNVAAMIDAGGNIYYLAKLAGILHRGREAADGAHALRAWRSGHWRRADRRVR